MARHRRTLAALAAVAALLAASTTAAQSRPRLEPFADARLRIELNATDGDAGLHVLLDGPAWREVTVTNPAGAKVLEVEAERVIRDYGLTELFTESSEPPFDEFPLDELKRLFPEGVYTFQGRTVEGQRLLSTARLSHDLPDGPTLVSPAPGASLAPGGVVVEWLAVTTPAGVDVAGYHVVVVTDGPGASRAFEVQLPATATRVPVPAAFLVPGAYKAEVLAIEAGGNQTLTEVPFRVGG